MAAKGGYNNVSHNHNDIGEFIVYRDGLPVLIDVGVESYMRKTFGAERYTLWTMQSAYHNLPTIDGVMQSDGLQYRASNVSYRADDTNAEFSLDIAGAYPSEAGLKTWQRSLCLQRGQYVEIKDRYELDHTPDSMTLSLMTVCLPSLEQKGMIRLSPLELIDGRKSGSALLHYDRDKLAASIELISTDDPCLVRDWGHTIYRVLLTAIHPLPKDRWLLRVGPS